MGSVPLGEDYVLLMFIAVTINVHSSFYGQKQPNHVYSILSLHDLFLVPHKVERRSKRGYGSIIHNQYVECHNFFPRLGIT